MKRKKVSAVFAGFSVAFAAFFMSAPPAANAGTFPGGVTVISKPIIVSKNNPLIGKGSGTTIIKAAPGFIGDMVITATGDTGQHNPDITIKGVTLDCAGQADQAAMLWGADNLLVQDVEATGCTNVNDLGAAIQARGFGAKSLTMNQRFIDVYVYKNAGHGLFSGYGTRRNFYSQVTAVANGRAGVIIGGSQSILNGVIADNNGTEGIWFRNLMFITGEGLFASGNNSSGIRVTNLANANLSVMSHNNLKDVWLDDTMITPDNYGVTGRQGPVRLEGTAGPSPFTISGTSNSMPGERALVIEGDSQADKEDLLLSSR